MNQAKSNQINIISKKLDDACIIEFGTRVVQKRDGGAIYPVYGGGGATFKMDTYNRENCLIVSRFAMSKQCVRFVEGKFFLNDSGLSVKPKKKNELAQEYLDYLLLSLNDTIYSLSRGTAQRNLNVSKFRTIEIKYPDSVELQLHIANILSKAENVIAQRKESISLLDEFLKTTFLEMFGDPVVNEKGWNAIPFLDVGKFKSGGTPSKERADFWDGDFPWVSPKDMKVSKIVDSQDHISSLVFQETALKRIPRNHLLIVVRGMILAHSFPVAINDVDVAINQDMKAIQLNRDFNLLFLLHCLNAMKRQILDLISTAGHGTRKFDTSAMQKLLVPLPPIVLQNKFAQIVEKTEALKIQYQKNLLELENLYGSLSHKALRGELIK